MARHEIDVEIRANPTEFLKEIRNVENEIKKLKSDWYQDDRATRKYATRADKIDKSYKSLNKQYALQQKLVTDLTAQKEELVKAGLEETETYKQLTGQMTEQGEELELLGKRLYGASLDYHQYFNAFSGAGRKLTAAGEVLTGIGEGLETVSRTMMPVTAGLTAIGTASFKAFKDYESGLVGVQKTTDFTKQELASFEEQINNIAQTKPLDIKDLLRVAELGGQLDVAKDQLASFSEVFNELSITTEMDIENASLKMAQFANVITPSGEVFNEWRELGNVVTMLGNNTATTEETIIEFANRLVGTGSIVGMTADEILGFSAVMGSAGLRAEAGGTNLSKTLMQMEFAVQGVGEEMDNYDAKLNQLGLSYKDVEEIMKAGGQAADDLASAFDMNAGQLEAFNEVAQNGTQQLDLYAGAAGMTADEFARLWKQDPAEAFTRFIEGLQVMEESGQSVANYLEMMGVSSERQREVILKLVSGAGDLRTTLADANKEWENGNALAEEAGKFYESTAGQIQQIKNNFEMVARELGEHLAPIVLEFSENVLDAVKGFGELDDETQKLIVKAGIFLAAIGPVTGILGNITKAGGGVLKVAGDIIGEKGLGGIFGKAKAVEGATKAIGEASAGAGAEFATAAGEISGAATETTGTIGAMVAKLGQWGPAAVAVATVAASAWKAIYEHQRTKDWTSDASTLTADTFIGPNGKMDYADRNPDLNGPNAGMRAGMGSYGETVVFEETTKELMTLAEERQQAISSIYARAAQERADLTQDEMDTISQIYHEQDMSLLEARKTKAEEELDLMWEYTDKSVKANQDAFVKIRDAMEEHEEEVNQRQAEIHGERQRLMEEYNEADMARRMEIMGEIARLNAEWRELEVEAFSATEEEKSVLLARSEEFRLKQNEETLGAMLEQAQNYKDEVISAAEEEFNEYARLLGKRLENGDITREEYNSLIQGAIDVKDETIASADTALSDITSMIEKTMPGWTVTVDEETGEIIAKNEETGESMEVTAETWSKAVENMKSSTEDMTSTSKGNIEGLDLTLSELRNSIVRTNNTRLENKRAVYTIEERRIRSGYYTNEAPSGNRRGYSPLMAGLSYVPYNDYYARLHEGERVLTKQENEKYNQASTENVADMLKRVEQALGAASNMAKSEHGISQDIKLEVNLNDVVVKDDRDVRQLAIDIGRELKKEVSYG